MDGVGVNSVQPEEIGRRLSRRRQIPLLIGLLVVSVAVVVLWQRSPTPDGPLLVVNPCPRALQASIFDSAEFPGRSEHLRAVVNLAPGVTRVEAIRTSEFGDEWSIEWAHDPPARMALRPKATGWFDDGVAVIPALSCGADDLSG